MDSFNFFCCNANFKHLKHRPKSFLLSKFLVSCWHRLKKKTRMNDETDQAAETRIDARRRHVRCYCTSSTFYGGDDDADQFGRALLISNLKSWDTKHSKNKRISASPRLLKFKWIRPKIILRWISSAKLKKKAILFRT